MKTIPFSRAMIAGLICTLAASVGRAETDTTRDNPGMKDRAAAGVQGLAGTRQSVAPANTASALEKWDEIKDLSYDSRDLFFVGLRQLDAAVDSQVGELTARRAAMKSTANVKEWDFAMKEMNDSRSYLKSVGDELRNANVETWNQKKETVRLAWVRTQEAYDAVKKSTTS